MRGGAGALECSGEELEIARDPGTSRFAQHTAFGLLSVAPVLRGREMALQLVEAFGQEQEIAISHNVTPEPEHVAMRVATGMPFEA